MCRNIGSTKYTNMSLIDKYFHEKVQLWEVRRVGDAGRGRDSLCMAQPRISLMTMMTMKGSMVTMIYMVSMMRMKSTTIITAVVLIMETSSGSSRTTTPHSLQANSGETPGNEVKVLICKCLKGTFKDLRTINDRIDIYPAVDSCADDACAVGTLKVAFHDLVQFSITQTLKYQYIYALVGKVNWVYM